MTAKRYGAGDFPAALRLARKTRGLTQAQAGKLVGVRVETFGEWERGTRVPTEENRLGLIDALGIDPAALAIFDPGFAASELFLARTAAGLSRPELAKMAGVSAETVARIEGTGRFQVAKLAAIVEALTRYSEDHAITSAYPESLAELVNMRMQAHLTTGGESAFAVAPLKRAGRPRAGRRDLIVAAARVQDERAAEKTAAILRGAGYRVETADMLFDEDMSEAAKAVAFLHKITIHRTCSKEPSYSVATLPGWEASPLSVAVEAIAAICGLEVLPCNEWIMRARLQ